MPCPGDINIAELEDAREEASEDKADLFDFYNKHWNSLIAEIIRLQKMVRQ